MSSLKLLQRQIATAKELQSVVKTMKILAAASIRQYEQAVESLAEYSRTVEMGLQVVLEEYANSQTHHQVLPSSTDSRLGVIILGSDQGMCGPFNQQIIQQAIAQIKNAAESGSKATVLAIGAKITAALESADISVETCFTMPSSLISLTPRVQDLLLHIETWRSQRQINQILLFHNQLGSNLTCEPHTLRLFPLDQTWLQHLRQLQWNSRTLPMFTLNRQQLFSSLIRQYFFVCLYRAFAESLASENASRLASMQVAEQNIEEHLAALNTQLQQQRQTSITAELLDIVAGFEALTQSIKEGNGELR